MKFEIYLAMFGLTLPFVEKYENRPDKMVGFLIGINKSHYFVYSWVLWNFIQDSITMFGEEGKIRYGDLETRGLIAKGIS